jgi:hypothetical protein
VLILSLSKDGCNAIADAPLAFCASGQIVRKRCRAFVQFDEAGVALAHARQNFAAIDG